MDHRLNYMTDNSKNAEILIERKPHPIPSVYLYIITTPRRGDEDRNDLDFFAMVTLQRLEY